nr:hypothetical protein [Tanacetum cinerariifolium]
MKDNEVWDLVDLPPNGKTVGSKWLFKKKTNMDGVVQTYKARLIAKGFWQMNVKTVFLNGHLFKEVYMVQPEGNNFPMLQDVKSYPGRCFAMKDLGEAAYILGIKIYRDRSKRVSCYTDAGYPTDADNLKSQIGYVFVLNGGVVGWKSTKQSTVFREPPYPFNYPMRRLTMEEILAKFIDEGKRKHEEMEIFIKEFRTTNELLLKTRCNLLSELKIKVTSEAAPSKENNETGINENEPPRLEEACTETINKRCLAVLLNELPLKEKDPRSFTIPCQVLEKRKEAKDLAEDHLCRRCVAGSETLEILARCHSGPTSGHHSASVTAKKVYESEFYWPSIFMDANEYVRRCNACQRSGNISSRNEMRQNNIQGVVIRDEEVVSNEEQANEERYDCICKDSVNIKEHECNKASDDTVNDQNIENVSVEKERDKMCNEGLDVGTQCKNDCTLEHTSTMRHAEETMNEDDIHKDETTPVLKTFILGLENLLSLKVKVIRCDNGTEFKNSDLNQFCGLKDSLLPIPFWAEAVNTACYVQNRVLVTKPHNKTPYELLHGRLPSIGFMRPFGCLVIILNTLDHLGKFQGKVDEGFLVGYSVCSKAFRVFKSRTRIVQETLHVNFMENKPNVAGSGPAWLFDIDSLTRTMNYHPVIAENQTNSHA